MSSSNTVDNYFHCYIITDVSDIQIFVDVSLATAAGGEDDLAQDKLSNLSTIGNGFGSLIYKLENDAGYQDLCHHCIPLWEALENKNNLPKLLVSKINDSCTNRS